MTARTSSVSRRPVVEVSPADIQSKSTVRARLAQAWSRTIAEQMDGNTSAFAGALQVDRKTVSAALGDDSLPEFHTALNSLRICPNALAEVFALYGFRLVPLDVAMSPDMMTLTKVCRLAGSLSEALEDGRRDHRETIELAHEIRDLMPALNGLVEEADAIKSGDNVRSIAR